MVFTAARRHRRSSVLRSFLFVALLATGIAHADDLRTRRMFDLPSDDATAAIRRFSEQTGLQVVYPSDVSKGLRTRAVKGEMTPREALDTMLTGTGIRIVQDEKTGAFSLARAALPNEPGATPNPSSARPTERGSARQAGNVEGSVQHAASGEFLRQARLVVGSGEAALTDDTGGYRLSLPAGEDITVRASYPGLEPQEFTLRLAPGERVRRDFALAGMSRPGAEGKAVSMAAFTVAAAREMDAAALAINEQRHAPNIKQVLAADAFGDVSEGNLGEFVKRMPGVNIANEAAGDALQLSLRGFGPEFTAVTLDGNSVPGAGASAGTVDRGITMQQVGTNNVSRIEVIKSPLPSVSADFLGGSVNLISKSAFDRSRPQLIVGGTLQWSQFDNSGFEWGRSPAFFGREARRVRPGYDFSYVKPVTKDLGFTLGASLSDQFGSLYGPLMAYEYNAANGGSQTAPYLRQFRTTDDPRETRRQTYSGSVDWRPWEPLTLTAAYVRASNDQKTYDNRLAVNVGTTPASYGPEFTQGRAGAGTLAHQQIYVDVLGATDHFKVSGKYRRGAWRADLGATYAVSDNKYVDMENGAVRSAGTAIVSPTVRFDGISRMPYAPRVVEVRNTAGALVDWTKLASYRITNITSAPRDARDEIATATLNVRRELSLGRNQAALQLGGDFRQRTIDRHGYTPTWTFVGADRIANTADDAAGPFADRIYTRVNQGSGVPSRIEFPDLWAFRELFRRNPEYFVLVEPTAFISRITNSERVRERVSAAYLQGEIRLAGDRLGLIGGVRFEHTASAGVGRLFDRQGHLQRDAAGNLLRNAAGNPIPVTTDALQVARLQYRERGASAGTAYDDFFPSINATYRLTSALQLRLSGARTMGRPNFSNIVPNVDVQENTATTGTNDGTIVLRNPGLRPWTANNYEVAAEYYFKSSGVVSASLFHKDISGAFVSQTSRATAAMLADYGLSGDFLDWNVTTTVNLGDAMSLSGAEFAYQQALAFLPAWAQGLSVFANGTLLKKDGPDATFSTLYRRTANWGLRYSRGRLGLGLNWNALGSRSLAFTGPPNGVRYTKPSVTLDFNAEMRVTPQVSVFFNARNVTNARYRREVFNAVTPAYARPYQDIENGSKMSVGVRARL